MCGIAGFFIREGTPPGNSLDVLRDMGEVIRHRGPDDYGEYLSGRCGFVFRRLAIIDVEHGHQPMVSGSERSAIVFNGEIYNYPELKRELESLGSAFRTNSDTEVILQGYEMWGAGVLDKLRGIFALAIYDLATESLFLARDHTGVKPLYFSTHAGRFVFASEIKAILKYPGIEAAVNVELLPKYLSFLWVPAPETLFRGIRMLEPGHSMVVTEEGIQKRRYWNPRLTEPEPGVSESEWLERLESSLSRVVKEQMISDVPLGAFLSGGVDSSTIVTFMNRTSPAPVTTYTTGFSPEDIADDVILSDLESARLAAKVLNVDYHEIILSPDAASLLPQLVWHMDEPVADPAAVTTFLICQAAKAKCSVMLSGVGGDEIFGGYPRYLANQWAQRYQRLPRLLRNGVVNPGIARIPTGSRSLVRNAKKFLKSADMSFDKRYFGYLTYYSQDELQGLLRFPFKWEEIFDTHSRLLEEYRSEDPLQTMMNLDLMTFLPNLNLMYTDKMSSGVAVEVRVPFLDHLLIEEASRIPGSLKIRNGKRKYILKKLAERYLPSQIVWRKKAGFGAPIGAWLKGGLREMMLDLLSEATVKRRGYFNPGFVRRLVDDHLSRREYNANQVWQLMTLELWHQIFIDQKPSSH
jgi:asparagine synthase (glutamine-hydrolysing)